MTRDFKPGNYRFIPAVFQYSSGAMADPGYEAPMWAAQVSGASVLKVPLCDAKGAACHDIKAMLAAASNPGVIYICNPNNPTGTCTPRKDIEYAVAHAPKDTILLIDEAYIHLCDEPRSLDFVRDGKNVIVAGAARGIGRAIVRAFAGDGANVFACDRLVNEIEAGERVKALAVDVTDAKSVEAVVSAAGFADQLPVAPNDTDDGRKANRRIEIVLVPNIEEMPSMEEIQKG